MRLFSMGFCVSIDISEQIPFQLEFVLESVVDDKPLAATIRLGWSSLEGSVMFEFNLGGFRMNHYQKMSVDWWQ